MNEWEFTAKVASWINEIISSDPSSIFLEATCEAQSKGSQKRRDLTLLNKNKVEVLTGEVKLPYATDGGSPMLPKVVEDARKKAARAKVSHFFTWNVNECVLWETETTDSISKKGLLKKWHITEATKPDHLEYAGTQLQIKSWLEEFLHEFSNILQGNFQLGTQSLDEKFIESLESALKMPILFTLEELTDRYKNTKFRNDLNSWMRDQQGWIISDDENRIRENLERAAKFSNFALANKLVFHEALLKRYHSAGMEKIIIADHIDSGEGLRGYVSHHFTKSIEITGDYETIFGEDYKELGNRIPFYSDKVVPHWRGLTEQIHAFDFSKLDYEVIGSIFERLIAPEERHKYGQFYTRPEVVDLINSFAIKNGDERVMDPACGGGTFLVRAYVRKKELAQGHSHFDLLSEIYGTDISHFAAHLTTINLATRDLIEADNYPRVARRDFFNVEPDVPFLSLPAFGSGVGIKQSGKSKDQPNEIKIPKLDSIVGNPPYVRQEDIPKSSTSKKKAPKSGTKEYFQQLVTDNWPGVKLSGRSDLHVYFWPQAARFLKDNGYLCLLTSSGWLDVEYGFRLQDWILQNFKVLAIFESIEEPWFIGARVATAVTILQKEADAKERMENVVRFVQLRRPLAEILAHDGTSLGAVDAADSFRDEILTLKGNTTNERYRARLISQADLWNEGVELGELMGKGPGVNERKQSKSGTNVQHGVYYGGKWGVYIRSSDLWFDLLDNFGDKFVPLGELAEVRYGIKTGCDNFFYPKDISNETLLEYPDSEDLNTRFGVSRAAVKNDEVRIVKCGENDSEIKVIESTYLEPEVHSLREIDRFTIGPEDCSNLILLVDKSKKQLKGTHVLDYIKWGEEMGFHTGATCASRAKTGRGWYDLTDFKRAEILWAKERQYRHVAPINPNKIAANCRLYEIYPKEELDREIWGGILNSSWTLLSLLQYGRTLGNEGAYSTMVVDVNMMRVPDTRKVKKSIQKRIEKAFEKLKERDALSFLSERHLRKMSYTQSGKAHKLEELSDLSELDMIDRRELDDAVLEMLGVDSAEERGKWLNRLYDYLREFFEQTREKEERAIANKKKAQRKSGLKAKDVAGEIYNFLVEDEPKWLQRYDVNFIEKDSPCDVYDLPDKGKPEYHFDLFIEHAVRFSRKGEPIKVANEAQAQLIIMLAEAGMRGLVRAPHDGKACQKVQAAYQKYLDERQDHLQELIEERTSDEDLQEKILAELNNRIKP